MNTLTAAPPTQELLLPLRPELRPLPKRLNPRRQPPAHRFMWFLATAVVGAVIAGMWLMQARYGVDVTDVSR